MLVASLGVMLTSTDVSNWRGGSVDLRSAHGRIKLSFMDEPEAAKGWGGFFGLFKAGYI